MAKIDNSIIQRVLDATDIVDVVGEFVELKKKGARYIGLCPFHDDRHATNFVVYPAKRCYTCFACGAKGDAVTFLKENQGMSFADAIRWLGKRVNIDIDDRSVSLDVKRREPPPPLPTLFLPTDMMTRTLTRGSTFHRWLLSLPWTANHAARIDGVLEEYNVGATKQGFTVFWQVDDCGGIRTGHCMAYQPDGHRVQGGYATDWIHTMLRRDVVRDELGRPVKDDAGDYIPRWPQYSEDKVEMRQTLFGMHLLSKYPNADVHIVESEKTALICAIYFGNDNRQLWMASCGKYNLTAERLAPIIKARRVIALHPDKDGADEWRAKMNELAYSKAYINDAMMKLQWKEEDGPKADMADIIVRLLEEQRRGKPMKLAEAMNLAPATRLLIDKFNCDIHMDKRLRPTAKIKRMANLMGEDKAKYEMMQTKVRPVIYAKVKRIAKRMGLTDYVIIQMMVDCIVRYMDSQHNLTPEMEKIMAIFEHMEGWGDAFNHADPTVKRIVGEAVYFLFDEEGKKKGCRAVHVTKPFFGNWSEDMNIQHILERVICLMMPERYRRLRALAVDMDCSSLLELFDHLIDLHAQDSDVATFRQLFEDADRSEWGAKPSDVRYKRVRAKHLNEEPTFFTDLNDNDDGANEEIDFEDQIIKP